MKRISYITFFVVSSFLLSNCTDNSDNRENKGELGYENSDSLLKSPETIVQEEINTRIDTNAVAKKLFQTKIVTTPNDSIISYKLVKTKDKNCTNWIVPSKTELMTIIKSFYELSGDEWHDCYGDWSCGIEGKIFFQSKEYNYRLDAGGWIILFNKNEQIYFGCKNPDCKKYFPSDCFCNEIGIIDE